MASQDIYLGPKWTDEPRAPQQTRLVGPGFSALDQAFANGWINDDDVSKVIVEPEEWAPSLPAIEIG